MNRTLAASLGEAVLLFVTSFLTCSTLTAQQQIAPPQVLQQKAPAPNQQQMAPVRSPAPQQALPWVTPRQAAPAAAIQTTPEQQAAITRLIDDLVYDERVPLKQPVVLVPGITREMAEQRARFAPCQKAFAELSALGEVAFPQLLAHLEDKRASIPFRNHYLGHSVGDACYWIVFDVVQDRPDNYSEYGLSRKGRDGKNHEKPYWSGTPFDKAGGLKPWLEQHKHLSLRQKQIVCLTWLLDGEKAIGASDAASYYKHLLPLEIRILEHRVALSDNAERERLEEQLKYWQRVQREKLDQAIPRELLPAK